MKTRARGAVSGGCHFLLCLVVASMHVVCVCGSAAGGIVAGPCLATACSVSPSALHVAGRRHVRRRPARWGCGVGTDAWHPHGARGPLLCGHVREAVLLHGPLSHSAPRPRCVCAY